MCESCGRERTSLPVNVLSLPMVVMLCGECRAAGAIPYDLLVIMVGTGVARVDPKWASDVAMYHGKSSTEFEADCANLADKILRDLNDNEGDGFGPHYEGE